MALKFNELNTDPKFTMNNNNARPFSEPPPYPGPVNRTSYSHLSNSTMNKFTSSRNESKSVSAGIPGASLDQLRNPYVPLGEVRRHIPNQIRPASGQQVLLPNQGPSSYQALPAFNQQISLINLRPTTSKDDVEEDPLAPTSEEELVSLSVPVLARRLIEVQNRVASQASEIKGNKYYSVYFEHCFFLLFLANTYMKIFYKGSSHPIKDSKKIIKN